MKMNNFFFSFALVEINSQRIRRGFAMLCDSTETALRLHCKCAETALRIDSQWSRSQIRQSVRAAKVVNYNYPYFVQNTCIFLNFQVKCISSLVLYRARKNSI